MHEDWDAHAAVVDGQEFARVPRLPNERGELTVVGCVAAARSDESATMAASSQQ